MFSTLVALFLCGVMAQASVIPQGVDIRIIDLQPPNLNVERKVYDHEAFLGKEQAGAFDRLSPEESQRRLGLIYDKIDEDGDGKLSHRELEDWIEYIQLRYIRRNVENQWRSYDGEENGSIRWGHFKEKTYGQLADDERERPGFKFGPHMKRDQRRWQHADHDQDSHLTIEEFTDFLHPEESQHMKNLVVQETIEDIDKDKDGKISLQEYLNDLRPEGKDSEEWMEKEKKVFVEHRDRNKDGFMDGAEVSEWIMPQEYNHIQSEAAHLIYVSDVNKDGELNLQEVLDRYDVFVGSQATDFGEALENHDEF